MGINRKVEENEEAAKLCKDEKEKPAADNQIQQVEPMSRKDRQTDLDRSSRNIPTNGAPFK